MQIISNNYAQPLPGFRAKHIAIKNMDLAKTIPNMLKSGATLKQISLKTGKSEATISQWIKVHLGKKITDIRREVKEYLKKEKDDAKAAKELNMDIKSIQDTRLKYGIVHKASRFDLYQERRKQIFQMFREGAGINDITQKFGVTPKCAYNYRADYLEEELNVMHNSEEDKIRYIKTRLDSGVQPDDIIKELGGLGRGLCNKILEERAIAERSVKALYKEKVTNLIVDKLRSGMTLHQIEEETNIPFGILVKYATAGDKKSAKIVNNIFRARYIMDRLREGLNIEDVAKLLNVDRTTAYRYLGKDNIRELRELKRNAILEARKKKPKS